MQSFLAESGVVAIRYRCNICPHGCELKDNLDRGAVPFMHQHKCHRSPSLTTAWERIA